MSIRRLVAEQLYEHLPSSGQNVSDAVSRLGWCVRLKSHSDQSKTHASILHKHLNSCQLLDDQLQWAKQLPRANIGSPVQQVTAENYCLNIKLDLTSLKQHVIRSILTEQEHYGTRSSIHNYLLKDGSFQTAPRNENVIVEYSSPNIAKPFHAGHLRSTVLGNFLANLNACLGHKVSRLNYLGDWGTQFGMLAVSYLRYGDEQKLKTDAMKHLFDLYVRINEEAENIDPTTGLSLRDLGKQFFFKMENGDYAANSLWQYFRDKSVESYVGMYDRLGISFDNYHGESMYQKESKDIVEIFQERGMLSYSEGKGYVDLSDDKHKHLHATLIKSDGTTLYLSRDLAAAIDRQKKYNFDRMYYVVDQSQHSHFQCMLGCLQKLDFSWANRELCEWHVDFGRIEGMSTRTGEVVFLKDILDEAQHRMIQLMRSKDTTKVEEKLEAIADKLGISAIFIQDMKQPRRRSYKFSWERMLQFSGETGVRIQYAHARLCSLERECGVGLEPSCSLESLQEPAAYNLIMHLARYDEAISEAFCDKEPYHLTKYIFTLVSLTNVALKELQVKHQPFDVSQARLVLFHSSRLVLANAMRLLGLIPLERI